VPLYFFFEFGSGVIEEAEEVAEHGEEVVKVGFGRYSTMARFDGLHSALFHE